MENIFDEKNRQIEIDKMASFIDAFYTKLKNVICIDINFRNVIHMDIEL